MPLPLVWSYIENNILHLSLLNLLKWNCHLRWTMQMKCIGGEQKKSLKVWFKKYTYVYEYAYIQICIYVWMDRHISQMDLKKHDFCPFGKWDFLNLFLPVSLTFFLPVFQKWLNYILTVTLTPILTLFLFSRDFGLHIGHTLFCWWVCLYILLYMLWKPRCYFSNETFTQRPCRK